MKSITRRELAQSVALATAAGYSRILGANDRVGMGYIGVGNRGDQVHDSFLEYADHVTTAVCDLREDYMDFAVKKSRAAPKKYKDYQRLLEDKEVDAVVIATPDHWHALMFIDACNAGKDVYVEKPLSLTVLEGRKMVEAAARHKRVTQVGTHRRSNPNLREAAELVRSGGVGPVTMAKCYHIMNDWPVGIGSPRDSPPPSEEEWDRWLGPAPKVPYNRNRTYYNFRWFYHYSGGQLTNFGVHYLDMMRWCLGQDAPRAVTAMGGKYAVRDNREIPDTLEVLWEFPGPTLVIFSQCNTNDAQANKRNSEMEFRGAKGTLYISGGRWWVEPENITEMTKFAFTPLDRQSPRSYAPSLKPAMEPQESSNKTYNNAFLHARNFLDCIKSRGKCNADVLDGHLSTTAAILGNIAHKSKSYLEWDPRQERFTNNQAANRLLHYQYRAPYKLG